MFLGLPDPDPLVVSGMDPDPSIILLSSSKNSKKTLIPTVCEFFWTFLSLKYYVNVPSKSRKTFFLLIFVLKVNDKRTGSEYKSGSGSISQRHGSADPDPHQNFMDPEHCFPVIRTRIFPCIHLDQVGSSEIKVGCSGSFMDLDSPVFSLKKC
jgi:hypothetical protein